MSLNFDVSKIEDKSVTVTTQERFGEEVEVWSHELESIAFSGMLIGINPITADNWEKWYTRYVELNVASGTPRDEQFLSRETVEKFVGFSSNVTTVTDAAWRKKLVEVLQSTAQRRLRAEIYEAEQAAKDRAESETRIDEIVELLDTPNPKA